MATNLEIIVGTYEQFLLGYKVEQVNNLAAFNRSRQFLLIESLFY